MKVTPAIVMASRYPLEFDFGLITYTLFMEIGPLHDPVTWYGINYTETQVTQWEFQNKGTRTSPARLSFVLEVSLRNLRPSVIYSVPCDRIVQRAYWAELFYVKLDQGSVLIFVEYNS